MFSSLKGGKGLIGLDIGEIKAVQLKEIKTGYQLEGLGIVPLLPELVVDGAILDSMRVVEAIKELSSEKSLNSKDVAKSCPNQLNSRLNSISLLISKM
jgi:type IV pilus assembly protein PilM